MMAYKQAQTYNALEEKIKQAHKAFDTNTDKAKHDK